MRENRNNAGFSLVELVVAIGIASIILVAGASFLNSVLKQYGKDNYEIKLQTEVEEILNLLENWIMDAESVKVVPGKNGENDKLILRKTLIDGSSIDSTIYTKDDNIYYNKIKDKTTTEVYLGTHIHVNNEVENNENQKNLIFSVSDNKKMVYVTINMSFGSATYDATRKILLRNWSEEESETTSTTASPPKKVKASLASVTVNPISGNNKDEFSIEMSLKNDGVLTSLDTIGGENGLIFDVYFFFGAKDDDIINDLKNINNWSCEEGNISSVSIENYPGSKDNGSFQLYYGHVVIKSTLDLFYDEKVSGSGWGPAVLKEHIIKCSVSSTNGSERMKMKEYSSYGISKSMSQAYIVVSYAGNEVCTYGDKYSKPSTTTEDVYTISYNANGGQYAPTDQTKKAGETIKLSTSIPSWDGHTFKGWATSYASSVVAYNFGANYSDDKSITLYAVWDANVPKITIKYDANGGQNAPADQSIDANTATTLSWSAPNRDGYSFRGWNTNKDSDEILYSSGQQGVSFDKSTTLYAIWSKNSQKYTISYDANGGSDAPDSQEKISDEPLVLTSKQPSREGYSFMGWAKVNSATTPDYQSGDTFNEDSYLTLYAVWKDERAVQIDVSGLWGTTVQLRNLSRAVEWKKLEVRYYYLYQGDKQNISFNKDNSEAIMKDNQIYSFYVGDTVYQYGYYSYTRNGQSVLAVSEWPNVSFNTTNQLSYLSLSDSKSPVSIGEKPVCVYYDNELIYGQEPVVDSLSVYVSDNKVTYSGNTAIVSFKINKIGNDINWGDVVIYYYFNESDNNLISLSNVAVKSVSNSISTSYVVKHSSESGINKEKANAYIIFNFNGKSVAGNVNDSIELSFTVAHGKQIMTEDKSFSCESSGKNIYGVYTGSYNLLNGNESKPKTFGSYPTRDIVSDGDPFFNPKIGVKYPSDNNDKIIKQITVEYELKTDNYWNICMYYDNIGQANQYHAFSDHSIGKHTETFNCSSDVINCTLNGGSEVVFYSISILYK